MKMNFDIVKNYIIRSLEEVIDPGSNLNFNSESQIFGEGSSIDSMDLVNAIMMVEESMREDLNVDLEVIDEQSIIGEDSPFKTVRSLTEHILMKHNTND